MWLLARPVNDACLNLLLAELFMLTDRSEGKRETWDCLRRRLDDYEGVSKALGVVGTQLSPLIAFATDGLNKIIKGGIPKPPSGPAV